MSWTSEPPRENGYYWAITDPDVGPEPVERAVGTWLQLGSGVALRSDHVRDWWTWWSVPMERPPVERA